MILDRLETTPDELERRTGWKIEPQGACKGDRCVPLPGGGAALDVRVLAERLEMALVHDSKHGLWALGPEGDGDRHGRARRRRSGGGRSLDRSREARASVAGRRGAPARRAPRHRERPDRRLDRRAGDDRASAGARVSEEGGYRRAGIA